MDAELELDCSRQQIDDCEPVIVWYETRGECHHPGPFDLDEHETCEHWFECVWGKLTNSAADPRDPDNPVAHLMLTTVAGVDRLLIGGPYDRGPDRGVTSAKVHNGIRYFTLEHQGRSWTWQLHAARVINRRTRDVAGTFYRHDGSQQQPIHELLLGRWVD